MHCMDYGAMDSSSAKELVKIKSYSVGLRKSAVDLAAYCANKNGENNLLNQHSS